MEFIAILILSFALQLFLPWWIMLVVAFILCAIISKTGKISFWQSFMAIFCLWIGYALFQSVPNNNLLAGKVAQMFGVKYWWAILFITGILSGLCAGISGLCGYHFRKSLLIKKQKS